MIYSYATKAWQPLVGCDMTKPCAKRCWARKTTRRTVECQRKDHPERAAFFEQALMPGTDIWNGKVFLDEKHLLDPLRWRKEQIVATGYHGDIGLLPHGDLARIFKVMAWCSQHQYLILSKRLEGIVRYCDGMAQLTPERRAQALVADADGIVVPISNYSPLRWPLPNVWLGTSVEDQAAADARLPHLMKLATLGWKTWVSIEPMTGPVDLRNAYIDFSDVILELIALRQKRGETVTAERIAKYPKSMWLNALTGANPTGERLPHLSWVVLGGESGPAARLCDVSWIRSIIRQCREARVPCWVKQLGCCIRGDEREFRTVNWTASDGTFGLTDRKGAYQDEWPVDLLVQQYPPDLARIHTRRQMSEAPIPPRR